MASPRLVPGGAGLEGVVGIQSASWAVTQILQGDTAGHLVDAIGGFVIVSILVQVGSKGAAVGKVLLLR